MKLLSPVCFILQSHFASTNGGEEEEGAKCKKCVALLLVDLLQFTWQVDLRSTRLPRFCVSGGCLSAKVITQRPHANHSSVGHPSFMRIDADGDAPRLHLIELKGKKISHLNANGVCPLELSHFFPQIDPGGLTSLPLMETELLMLAVI